MKTATRHENLRVLYFDGSGTLVRITEHSDAQRDRVTVPLRAIVTEALASGASALVLSHNHPVGDPHPSRADIAATSLLAQATAPLGIRVHDHIVTGAGRDFSFRAAGLL